MVKTIYTYITYYCTEGC